MFMTHEKYILVHSVLRSLSGGPVYITDIPGKSNEEIVRRLRLSDGTIPRPDSILTPFGDLFKNPYNEPIPIKAINIVNEIYLVFTVNVNKDGIEEETKFIPEELGIKDESLIYDFLGRLK